MPGCVRYCHTASLQAPCARVVQPASLSNVSCPAVLPQHAGLQATLLAELALALPNQHMMTCGATPSNPSFPPRSGLIKRNVLIAVAVLIVISCCCCCRYGYRRYQKKKRAPKRAPLEPAAGMA